MVGLFSCMERTDIDYENIKITGFLAGDFFVYMELVKNITQA